MQLGEKEFESVEEKPRELVCELVNRELVNIVIPTVDGAGYLARLLPSLKMHVKADFVVTVVQNGEHSGVQMELVKSGLRYNLIDNHGDNHHFAGSNNQGADFMESDYVLFLNDDTYCVSDFLTAMLDASKLHNADCVGAKIITISDGKVQHAGIHFDHNGYPFERCCGASRNDPSVSADLEICAVTGCCQLWKKSVYDALGGFDEGYRSSWEDSVAGDTPIFLRRRKIFLDILPIEDFVPDGYGDKLNSPCDFEVYSRSGWTKARYCRKHKVNKSIYKIVTKTGMVKATNDHSFFVKGKPATALEVKRLGNIDQVELLRLDANIVNMTDELAWVLGLFVAEGYAKANYPRANMHSWSISNMNRDLLEKARDVLRGVFCVDFVIRETNCHRSRPLLKLCPIDSKTILRSNRLVFAQWFSDQCYTRVSRSKKVPILILNGSDSIKKSFLSGLLDGDGHIEKRGNSIRTHLTTISPTLAAGVQYILGCFGQRASLLFRKDKTNVISMRFLSDTFGNKHLGCLNKRISPEPSNSIRSVDLISESCEYVYDISTEDESFVCALGGIMAHNTALCLSATEKGHKVVYAAKAEIFHVHFGTSTIRFKNEDKNRSKYEREWVVNERAIEVLRKFHAV